MMRFPPSNLLDPTTEHERTEAERRGRIERLNRMIESRRAQPIYPPGYSYSLSENVQRMTELYVRPQVKRRWRI
jgi:hypothetical protein